MGTGNFRSRKTRKQDFFLIFVLLSIFCCIIIFNIAEESYEVKFRREANFI